MTAWTSDELKRIANEDELQIASLRGDGTLRKFTTIWVVMVGDELYVRSVYGRGSDWFRGVQTRRAGHIRAGGVTRDVTFVEETDPALNDAIDFHYRAKYARYAASIIAAITSPEARSATLRLVPRDAAA
jgi:hypothetical protein